MQVCTSLQTDNHASTSPLSFLQTGCPSCRPTNSVKALKALFDRVLACKTTRRRQRYLRRSSEEAAAAVSPTTSESNGRISCESCLLTTHTSTLEPEPRSPSTPAAIASRTSCVASSRYSMHHRHKLAVTVSRLVAASRPCLGRHWSPIRGRRARRPR